MFHRLGGFPKVSGKTAIRFIRIPVAGSGWYGQHHFVLYTVESRRQAGGHGQVRVAVGAHHACFETGGFFAATQNPQGGGAVVEAPGNCGRGPCSFHQSFVTVDGRCDHGQHKGQAMQLAGDITFHQVADTHGMVAPRKRGWFSCRRSRGSGERDHCSPRGAH